MEYDHTQIKQARRSYGNNGISQKSLSAKIGVTEVTIWRWENKISEPRISHLVKMCEVLGIPLMFFLDRKTCLGVRTLYHVTTPKKAARYHSSGRIIKPVRGFSTLAAAQRWAKQTGRTIIYKFEAENAHKLPDHHNQAGIAYWNDEDVLLNNLECVEGFDNR